MNEDVRQRLRCAFEEVPDLYDRARPAYPGAVFDDLAGLTGLGPGAAVLEIGCGTGKATVELAERGYRVTCVELGAALSSVARRNLATFPDVEVITADFEAWEPVLLPPFDAVMAFTSFHWLDPATSYARCAGMLRPGGALAVTMTRHVVPADGDPLFVEIQRDYAEVVPEWDDGRPPPRPEDVPDLADEFLASGCFREVAVHRHYWDVVYSAQEYVDVLDTYSGHRAMPADRRQALYDRIRRRVEERRGGTVRKTYLAVLHVARRL